MPTRKHGCRSPRPLVVARGRRRGEGGEGNEVGDNCSVTQGLHLWGVETPGTREGWGLHNLGKELNATDSFTVKR